MTYEAQPSSARPALSAIRRALPQDRRHLFLRLMPFSYSGPEEFGLLQTLVHECFTADASRRATALTDLVSLFESGLQDVPRHHEFIVEMASHVQARHFSCVAAEAEFVARLDMVDVTLDEFRTERGTAGVPALVGEVHWVDGEPFTIRREVIPLARAIDEMTSWHIDLLAGLPVRERMAGIRLIRLFCMFGRPGTKGSLKQARLHFLRTQGIAVWRALARRGFDGLDVDAGLYGEPAVRRLELALSEDMYAVGLNAASPNASAGAAAGAMTATDEPDALLHTVVTASFPPTRDDPEKGLLKQYEPLRRPMPVARLPSRAALDQAHTQLLTEFPWAEPALGALFEELSGRSAFGSVKLGFQPLLFVGPAGTGKSRLARRIAEVLGIQSMTTSLGGATDALGILGTARGWSSGQPSPLLRPLLKGCASVLMCFDEVDKAADSTRNSPPIQSALLSLLEPEEARRWRDPFLQVECDLRSLLFVFTCNDDIRLSAALRSRLRILHIERPTSAQLHRVVPYVLRDVEREWGLPSGALDGVSVHPESLRGASSMRDLQRAVVAVARAWISNVAGAHRH